MGSRLDELQRSGASLAAIWLTHNHSDHIGGVPELLCRWDVPVIGADGARIAQRTLTARRRAVRIAGLGTFPSTSFLGFRGVGASAPRYQHF